MCLPDGFVPFIRSAAAAVGFPAGFTGAAAADFACCFLDRVIACIGAGFWREQADCSRAGCLFFAGAGLPPLALSLDLLVRFAMALLEDLPEGFTKERLDGFTRMMEVLLALSCVAAVPFDMVVRGFAVFSELPIVAFFGFAFGSAEVEGLILEDPCDARESAFAFGAALAVADTGGAVVTAGFAAVTGCAAVSGSTSASADEAPSSRSALDASSAADGFATAASSRAAPAGF